MEYYEYAVDWCCLSMSPSIGRWERKESFKLNVSAGSQKRTIHKPEGKDESRFSLKIKRNINVTIVKYILSLFGQTLSLFGQTNCVGLRTLCPKRLQGGFGQIIRHSLELD